MAEEYALPPSHQNRSKYPYQQKGNGGRSYSNPIYAKSSAASSRTRSAGNGRSRVIGQGVKSSVAAETERLERETRELAARLKRLTPYQAGLLGRLVFRKHPNQAEILASSHQKLIEIIFRTAIKTKRQPDVSGLIDKLLSQSSDVRSVAMPASPRPAPSLKRKPSESPLPTDPTKKDSERNHTDPSIRTPLRQSLHRSAIQPSETLTPHKTGPIKSTPLPRIDAAPSPEPALTAPPQPVIPGARLGNGTTKEVTLLLTFDGRHEFNRLRAQLQAVLLRLGIDEIKIHNIARIMGTTHVFLSLDLPSEISAIDFVRKELERVSLPILDVAHLDHISIESQNFWRIYLPKASKPRISA